MDTFSRFHFSMKSTIKSLHHFENTPYDTVWNELKVCQLFKRKRTCNKFFTIKTQKTLRIQSNSSVRTRTENPGLIRVENYIEHTEVVMRLVVSQHFQRNDKRILQKVAVINDEYIRMTYSSDPGIKLKRRKDEILTCKPCRVKLWSTHRRSTMQTKGNVYEMQLPGLHSCVNVRFCKDRLISPNRTTTFYDRTFQQLSYRHLQNKSMS